MADSGNTAMDETERLEAALARIALARRRPGDAALATRLDALIAEVRSVLGRDAAD